MELITKYDGAVFFVDLLGMTALTNNLITLENKDYECWLSQYGLEYTNQYLAASLLADFRKILIELNEQFDSVTVSQLSDCAFVWSKNITDIVVFSSQFMTKAISSGLLCRGGLTYGEIIETNQNHELGRFIVGKAVTDAAKLEGIAKGSRVLIDKDFPNYLNEFDSNFAGRTIPLFVPFINPLDYQEYDEFKWYLCPNLTHNVSNLSIMSFEEKRSLTKKRLKLANIVRCSPKFSWNSKSKEGLVQVKATINFIAENGLLDVFHTFAWESTLSKRDENFVENLNRIIDENQQYATQENKHLLSN
jgi:hypothetical protein